MAAAPASFPVPASPSADGGGLPALTVLRGGGSGPVIGDSAGRQVLLRGVNVNQLVDYGQPDKSKPTVRPLADADYAQMASEYGFDVQRLNLSWSQLEPARGQFSQAYIARVRQAVDWAAAHGIYTVLDMHQDTYSKYVTATPGTTCRTGASPEFGNDGAPAWATLSDGAKGCGFQGRDLSPNVRAVVHQPVRRHRRHRHRSSPTPGASWRGRSPATPRWPATTCSTSRVRATRPA